MSKFLQLLTLSLLMIGLVGCSQTEKTEKAASVEKQDGKSEEVVDSKKSKDENIINNIIGTSWMDNHDLLQNIISFEKDNDKIVMYYKGYSYGRVIMENQLKFKVKDIKNDKIQSEITNEDGSQVEITFIVKDKQNMEIEGLFSESIKLKRLVTVDDPEYQDMTSELEGNWIDKNHVDFNIYKENGQLVVEVIGEEAKDQYEFAIIKFEIYGNVDNNILVTLVEQNGHSAEGYKVLLTLREDGRLGLDEIILTKSN